MECAVLGLKTDDVDEIVNQLFDLKSLSVEREQDSPMKPGLHTQWLCSDCKWDQAYS